MALLALWPPSRLPCRAAKPREARRQAKSALCRPKLREEETSEKSFNKIIIYKII